MVAERFPDLNQDYYGLLGLSPAASLTEIRQAYRDLSKQYHPDTTVLDPEEATQKFQQLQEAYTTLSNAEQRRQYDLWRTYLAKRAAVALAEAELKGGPIAGSLYRREADRPEADRAAPTPSAASTQNPTPSPGATVTPGATGVAGPGPMPPPPESRTADRAAVPRWAEPGAMGETTDDRPWEDYYSSSAYLDAIDRPLSAGEVFALFLLGITFVGCIVLALALGIARGELILGDGL